MSRLRYFYLVFVFMLMGIQVFSQGQMSTNAIYQDKDGKRYEWKIIDSDALVWDGGSYVPFGLRVVFPSLETESIQTLSQADRDLIERIYSAGVKDIIISNGYQITHSNPKVLQEIIDLLDSKSMSYGIDFGEETDEPLKGFLVDPSRYRLDGPYPESRIAKMMPNVEGGLFTLVSKSGGNVVKSGVIEKNPNGQVNIDMSRPLDSNLALLFYPQVTMYNNFDIWQGYDQMRDRIISYFKNVKLGFGFRFFYNPFNAQKLEFANEMDYFIPNSPKFSLGFENYINKRYYTIGAVAEFWGMSKGMKEMSDYLKVIPLWAPGRGIPQFYNSKDASFIPVNTASCSYWGDLTTYRNQSVRYYMDSISDVLRKNIANVPVVFSARNVNHTYSMNVSQSSPDGFIYNPAETEAAVVNTDSCLLSTYADSYPRTAWLTVMNPKALTKKDLDELLELGYKGFFWDYKDDSDIAKAADFESGFAKSVVSEYIPRVIEYPSDSFIGIVPQKLDDNTWWLPVEKKSSVYMFGENIFGYTIEKSNDFVIWSTYDNLIITFPGLKDKAPVAVYPANTSIKKLKSVEKIPMYQMVIGKKPIVLQNINPGTFFPKEIAEKEFAKMEEMRKKYNTEELEDKLHRISSDKIKTAIKSGSYANAYGMSKEAIDRFLVLHGSDIWIDDMAFRRNSFSGFKPEKDASYGLTLVLDEISAPPVTEYYASTTVKILGNRNYTMWVAVSNDDISSDFEISHNGNPWVSVDKSSKIPYTDNLSWYKAGNFSFFEGDNIIDIKVTKPNPITGKYYLVMDAVVLVQDEFVPKNNSDRPDFITVFR